MIYTNHHCHYYYNNGIQGYKTSVYDGSGGLNKPTTTLKDNCSYNIAGFSQNCTIDLQPLVLAYDKFADNENGKRLSKTDVSSNLKIGHFQDEQIISLGELFY